MGIHREVVLEFGPTNYLRMAVLKETQDLLIYLFYTIIALALYCAFTQFRKIRKLPPGPWGKPIIGMIFTIKKNFHEYLTDYANQYGKIFSIQMGSSTLVVLSDPRIIKKAFSSRDFTARPRTELNHLTGGLGVVNVDLWKAQRTYLIHQKLGMRQWGHGMSQIESTIENEAARFVDTIHREFEPTTPLNPAPLINCAVSNVICSMIMSTRFDHDDLEFQRFMQNFDEGFKLFTETGVMIWLPLLKHIPVVAKAVEKLKANRAEMLQFVKKKIQEHKQCLDPKNQRDLIDSYLNLIEKQKQETDFISIKNTKEDIFHGVDPEAQLEQIILDLFSAGVETLKTSLLWSIIYMLHNPEVMKKCQAELDEKIRKNRLPNVKDMKSLVYTKATMYEIMRRSSVVPVGTTHSTERNIEFEGYTIPKNAHVIPLLHAVHMDPEVWDQPEELRPERFLNEDQTAVRKPDHFMPFGVGQRMCLGDQLAEKEFFLFFSSLLYCYDLKNPEGCELPSLNGQCAATLTPICDPYVICAPRNIELLNNRSILNNHFSELPFPDGVPSILPQNRTYG